MKFTDIFVRKPVLAIVVNLVIILAGLQAMNSLTVRQYPRSDNASVVITTFYTGASAELIKSFVTAPIEQAIAAVDGVEYTQSQSTLSQSTITARLKINYDPVKALAEINAKVNSVRGELPQGSEVPIIDIQSADSQFAAAYLSFTSDILENNEITDYLSRVVQPRLAALEGVQRADILGGKVFAMRIWLRPERMAALSISPSEVRQALASNNVLSAIGQTKGSLISVNLTANTDLRSVEGFKRLVIREDDGATIRVEDIADVELGSEFSDIEVRFSGDTATFMGIWPLPNANAIDVIQRARDELEEIKKSLPSGLNARFAYDSTEYIESAISEVVTTLIETLLIVIAVIFLFLGSARSAIIPVLVIPLALIGAVFLIQIFGFTINLLTLLAIVLSVGLVVDDAIVVVENVQRHIGEGKTPFDAAIIGARELVNPVIAMTITLAAVYLPIALQGGLTGALFREFALTLAGAVMISGIVAVTLSPMLASKMLRPNMSNEGFAKKTNDLFDKFKTRYGKILSISLKNRLVVYFVWLFIGLLCVPMFIFSAKELAPTEDQGIVFGILETPSNSTLEQTIHYAEHANNIFLKTPETDYTFQITGSNFGFGGLVSRPWNDRDRTLFEVMPELQQQLGAIPGIQMFPIMPPALPGGGDFPVEFALTSTVDTEIILNVVQTLQQKAMASGMFAFLNIDTKIDQPQSEIVIDREKVADLGLTLAQVSADMGVMMGGNYVNRFNLEGRSYRVIPQVKRNNRLTTDQLQDIYISGPNGQLIPLSSIARVENMTVPRSLNRLQQLNSVKLSGVAIRPLDDALAFLETEAKKIMPPGFVINYTGESRQLRTEGNKFIGAFILAIALIFFVLAAQFNSFRDPLVILAGSVPLALFGALVFTFLKIPAPDMPFWTNGWTTTLNIYSQVGLVTLIGLISKNGILVVEFANKLQEQGKQKLEAVYEAAMTRLRPIMMTTAATVIGHFPLVLVTGAGAEARNSIGLVLVGGMTIGTMFTLFIIPSLYMLIAKDHSKVVEPESNLALDNNVVRN